MTGCFLVQCSFFNPMHQWNEDRIWNLHSVAIKQKLSIWQNRWNEPLMMWWNVTIFSENFSRNSERHKMTSGSASVWSHVANWDACVTDKRKQKRLEMTETEAAGRLDGHCSWHQDDPTVLPVQPLHIQTKKSRFQLVNKRKQGWRRVLFQWLRVGSLKVRMRRKHCFLTLLSFKLAEIINQLFSLQQIW